MGTVGVVTIVVALGLALGACENAGGGGGDSGYVVSFTVDGTEYVLTEGYTADNVFDAGANGSIDGARLEVTAVGASVTDMTNTPGPRQGPFVWISFDSAEVGLFATADVFFGVVLAGGDSHSNDETNDTGFSAEITSFSSSVGGTIEGTFGGAITIGDPDITIENGFFRVERLPDDSLSGPGAFE